MKLDEPSAKKPKLKIIEPTKKLKISRRSERPKKDLNSQNGNISNEKAENNNNEKKKGERDKDKEKDKDKVTANGTTKITRNSRLIRNNVTQSPRRNIRRKRTFSPENFEQKSKNEKIKAAADAAIDKPKSKTTTISTPTKTSSSSTPDVHINGTPKTPNSNSSISISPSTSDPSRRTTRRQTEKIKNPSGIRIDLEIDQQNFIKMNNLPYEMVDKCKFYAILINLFYWNKRYDRDVKSIFRNEKFLKIIPEETIAKFREEFESADVGWEKLIMKSGSGLVDSTSTDENKDAICLFDENEECLFFTQKFKDNDHQALIVQLTAMIYNMIKYNADYIILDGDRNYEPPATILTFAKTNNYSKMEILDCIHKAFCLHIHQLSLSNKMAARDDLLSGFFYVKFSNYNLTHSLIYNCIKKLLGNYKDARENGTKICQIDERNNNKIVFDEFEKMENPTVRENPLISQGPLIEKLYNDIKLYKPIYYESKKVRSAVLDAPEHLDINFSSGESEEGEDEEIGTGTGTGDDDDEDGMNRTNPLEDSTDIATTQKPRRPRRGQAKIHPLTDEINIPKNEKIENLIQKYTFPFNVVEKAKLYAYLIHVYVQSKKLNKHMNVKIFESEAFKKVIPKIGQWYGSKIEKEKNLGIYKEPATPQTLNESSQSIEEDSRDSTTTSPAKEPRALNPNTIVKYILRQKTLEQINSESKEERGSHTCDIDENFNVHWIDSTRGELYQGRRKMCEYFYETVKDDEAFLLDFSCCNNPKGQKERGQDDNHGQNHRPAGSGSGLGRPSTSRTSRKDDPKIPIPPEEQINIDIDTDKLKTLAQQVYDDFSPEEVEKCKIKAFFIHLYVMSEKMGESLSTAHTVRNPKFLSIVKDISKYFKATSSLIYGLISDEGETGRNTTAKMNRKYEIKFPGFDEEEYERNSAKLSEFNDEMKMKKNASNEEEPQTASSLGINSSNHSKNSKLKFIKDLYEHIHLIPENHEKYNIFGKHTMTEADEIKIPLTQEQIDMAAKINLPKIDIEKCKLKAFLLSIYVKAESTESNNATLGLFNCKKFVNIVPNIETFYSNYRNKEMCFPRLIKRIIKKDLVEENTKNVLCVMDDGFNLHFSTELSGVRVEVLELIQSIYKSVMENPELDLVRIPRGGLVTGTKTTQSVGVRRTKEGISIPEEDKIKIPLRELGYETPAF